MAGARAEVRAAAAAAPAGTGPLRESAGGGRRYVNSSYARDADFTLHKRAFLSETSSFVPLACIH